MEGKTKFENERISASKSRSEGLLLLLMLLVLLLLLLLLLMQHVLLHFKPSANFGA